ncbi:MAG TPA: Ig-like domain repeat protein [Acidimicrobiales bacterium]|nr:Ig-like domain repeat protein [Acidimicrobiales bacterium]
MKSRALTLVSATILAGGLLTGLLAESGAAGATGSPWAPGTIFVAVAGDRIQGDVGYVEAVAPNGSTSDVYFGEPYDVTTDAAGDVFVPDCNNGNVTEELAGGGSRVVISGLLCPDSVALDNSGNLLVGSFTTNEHLLSVPLGGGSPTALPVAGTPAGIAVDSQNDIYFTDGSIDPFVHVDVPGATTSESLPLGENVAPLALRLDSAGDLYYATTFGGDVDEQYSGSPSLTGTFGSVSYAKGTVVDSSGDVFISDGSSDVVKVAGGVQTTLLSGLDDPSGLAVWPPPVTPARVASTVTLSTTSPSSVSVTQSVDLTATVTSSGSPTGWVQFESNGGAVGSPVALSGGTASLTTTLPGGAQPGPDTDNVTAFYLGDGADAPAVSNTLPFTVSYLPVTVTLTTAKTTVHQDKPVLFTATVSGSDGVASGDIEFEVNGSSVADNSLDSSGTATATFSLPPGSSSVQAVFLPNASPPYQETDSNTLTMNAKPPFTTSVQANESQGSQSGNTWPITISVTVVGVSGQAAPSGTVKVKKFTCTALSPSGSDATSSCTANLAQGNYTVTIKYSGQKGLYAKSTDQLSFSVGNGGD